MIPRSALFSWKGTFAPTALSSSIISLVGVGQPALLTKPATSGHSSSLSKTESPSVSGHGQPLFSDGPATSTQLSTLFPTPSPSLSGHPFNSINPGRSGQ